MRTVLPSVLSVSLAALLLSACSGSGSSGSSPFDNTRPPTKINGLLDSSVSVAAKHKADIFAVPINTQGQPSQSNAGGFIGKHTKAKTNGEYETEFDGQYVNQPGLLIAYPLGLEGENPDEFIYTAAIGTVLFDGFGRGANMQVNINWITSLAADFAYTSYIDENGAEGNNPDKAMPGIYSVYTIERANLWLSKQFDLPDVVSTTPILPNQLNQFGHLASQERSNGIRYGALLAAGRSLAGSGNGKEWEWFKDVRNQQRRLLGQLYQNAGDEFSLCQLYTKAAASLSDVSAPQEAVNQYTYLSGKAIDYCATENEPTDIDVPFEQIEAWANVTVDAKNFLTDLNDRLNNIKGDKDGTCGQWSSEIQSDCIASFFDPAYITQAKDFYGPMQSLYEDHKEAFKQAQQELIDSVLAFTECLNDASEPCTEYKHKQGGLTFTLEPYEELKQGNEYYAFDFVISGTQSITDTDTADNEIAKITYKTATLNDADKTLQKPRVRVVYEGAYATPPVTVMAGKKTPETGGVEALGYDFYFPHLIIDNFAGNSLETLLSAKLIGVKPHSFDSAAHPYHYNYTELVMQSDIKDNNESKSRINIVIRTANGADFYAKNVWPNLEDLFKNEGGDSYYYANKAGANISDLEYDKLENLFSYSLMEGKKIVLGYACDDGKPFDEDTFKCSDKVSEPQPSSVTADYFEITPKGLGTNRYELYADETTSGKRLRNCAIPANMSSEEAEKNKVCTQSEWFYPEFEITDLLEKNDDGSYEYFSLFAFPGYGAYEPQFPEEIAEIGSVDGIRKLHYSHTLNDFSLLLDQRFKESPLAIAKVNFSKRTPTSWEVALSIGYDYNPEYRDAMESWGIWQTQGVLALGEKAQSLYFSYFVNDTTEEGADNQSFTELSGLMVYRGAVKLSGTATGHSLTIAGNKNYQTTGKETDIKGCGYLFADEQRKDHDNFVHVQGCENNEVAYLTFRSALIGVIREEQEGKFIARFSDGSAVKLDFMQSLPKFFLDDLNKKD